ncbi:MAG: hypothetical protein O7A71_05200 [Chloroflexi bacterium]|nr:hypothetical protein [Chloroflexota bacterium]
MRMILFLPAVVATLGAVFLVVVFAGIPAASSTEYLNADQLDAAAADGDLVVLGGVAAGSVAIGDEVAPRVGDGSRRVHVVIGLDGELALLAARDGPAVAARLDAVDRRVTTTFGGLGQFYGYIDTAHGWSTVAAVPAALWLVTLLSLWALRRRKPAGAAIAPLLEIRSEPRAEPMPEPVAEPLLVATATPEIEREPLRLPVPEPISVRPLERVVRPVADDPLLGLVREVARQAPQAGLRHARRVVELSQDERTLGWVGLAATALGVAAATYLVSSERRQKSAPKSHRRWL